MSEINNPFTEPFGKKSVAVAKPVESHPVHKFVKDIVKASAAKKKELEVKKTVDHGKPTSIVESLKQNQSLKQNLTLPVQENKFPAIRLEQQLNTIRHIIHDEFGGGKRLERILPAIAKVLVE